MKTIALETSVQPGSIALLLDDVTVYSKRFAQNRRTTQSFAQELASGLTAAGWQPSEVDLFAVCRGPGSYTGLRIGVTAGKTFAYAAGCHLLAADTLDVIALQAPAKEHDTLWVVMDAQRQQLYVATFRRKAGAWERTDETRIVDGAELTAGMGGGAAVTGPGLEKRQPDLPAGANVIDRRHWTPSAEALGRLGLARHQAGERQDYWTVSPVYYRPSAAEENWRQRHQG